MKPTFICHLICLALSLAVASSTPTLAEENGKNSAVAAVGSTKIVKPGETAQYELQAALINASPGDVIELQAGTYHFNTEINVVCDNVTIRGAGRDETVLSFRDQAAGSSGIVATGNAFVIENLAVEDTVGNAIKVLGAQDVTFRNVRVEWTDGPKDTNGAYGIYPVECSNVLIDNCVSIGASDAGIYVGQSQDVIVRGCFAKQNVAGIEIENTLRADVFERNHDVVLRARPVLRDEGLQAFDVEPKRDAEVFGHPWHRELLCTGQIGRQPRHQGAYLLLDHRHEYQDEPDNQADDEQYDEHHGQRTRYAAAEEAFDQRLEDVRQHEA